MASNREWFMMAHVRYLVWVPIATIQILTGLYYWCYQGNSKSPITCSIAQSCGRFSLWYYFPLNKNLPPFKSLKVSWEYVQLKHDELEEFVNYIATVWVPSYWCTCLLTSLAVVCPSILVSPDKLGNCFLVIGSQTTLLNNFLNYICKYVNNNLL